MTSARLILPPLGASFSSILAPSAVAKRTRESKPHPSAPQSLISEFPALDPQRVQRPHVVSLYGDKQSCETVKRW